MFDVWYVPGIVEYAKAQVGNGRFGRRGIADGTREQQVTGLVGQIVVHDLFGVPWPKDLGRGDGGADLEFWGMRLDVKTMGRKGPPRLDYVNNYSRLQEHFPTDLLIFCSLNWPDEVLTVCGWISKRNLLRKAKLSPAGSKRSRLDGTSFVLRSDLYEITNAELRSPDSFDALGLDLLLHGEAACRDVFTV